MGTPLPHPRLRQRAHCASPAPGVPAATTTADADTDPNPDAPEAAPDADLPKDEPEEINLDDLKAKDTETPAEGVHDDF